MAPVGAAEDFASEVIALAAAVVLSLSGSGAGAVAGAGCKPAVVAARTFASRGGAQSGLPVAGPAGACSRVVTGAGWHCLGFWSWSWLSLALALSLLLLSLSLSPAPVATGVRPGAAAGAWLKAISAARTHLAGGGWAQEGAKVGAVACAACGVSRRLAASVAAALVSGGRALANTLVSAVAGSGSARGAAAGCEPAKGAAEACPGGGRGGAPATVSVARFAGIGLRRAGGAWGTTGRQAVGALARKSRKAVTRPAGCNSSRLQATSATLPANCTK